MHQWKYSLRSAFSLLTPPFYFLAFGQLLPTHFPQTTAVGIHATKNLTGGNRSGWGLADFEHQSFTSPNPTPEFVDYNLTKLHSRYISLPKDLGVKS